MQAVEHRVSAVAEAQAGHLDRQRPAGQRAGGRRRWRRPGRRVEHVVDAVGSHDRPGHLLQQVADDPHREREDAEQGHRLDQLAGGDGAGGHPPCPDRQQRDGPLRRQQLQRRLERGPQPGHLQPGAPQGCGRGPHPAHLPVLEPEGLDHECAVERLVGHGGHLAEVGLGPGGRRLHPTAVIPVEQAEGGEQRQSDDHQQRVDGRQRHDRQRDEQDHAQRERQRHDGVHRPLDVGVGVRHQPAGGVAAEVAERDPQVGVGDLEEPGALHRPHQLHAEVAAGHHPERPQHGHRQEGRPAEQRGPLAHSFVEAGDDHLVGDPAQHPGPGHGHAGEHQRPRHRHREAAGVGAHAAPQQPGAAPPAGGRSGRPDRRGRPAPGSGRRQTRCSESAGSDGGCGTPIRGVSAGSDTVPAHGAPQGVRAPPLRGRQAHATGPRHRPRRRGPTVASGAWWRPRASWPSGPTPFPRPATAATGCAGPGARPGRPRASTVDSRGLTGAASRVDQRIPSDGVSPRRPPGPAAGPPQRAAAGGGPVPRLPDDGLGRHRPGPCRSWPTASPARWAGRRWRSPTGGAGSRRASSRSAGGSTTSPTPSTTCRWRCDRSASGSPASAPAVRWPSARPPPTSGSGRGRRRLAGDFDDWAGHPRRLLEHGREVGVITDPAFPPSVEPGRTGAARTSARWRACSRSPRGRYW